MSELGTKVVELHKRYPYLWIVAGNAEEYSYFDGENLFVVMIKRLIDKNIDNYLEVKLFYKDQKNETGVAEVHISDDTKKTLFTYFKDLDQIENNERFISHRIDKLLNLN